MFRRISGKLSATTFNQIPDFVMRKVGLIFLFSFLFFLIEFFLFNILGRWFMPNLLLLMVIYFNWTFGIRYSIFAAVLAGILKDSFSASIFGINIFSFVLCAYMTTVLKKYFHQVTSRWSRTLLVISVVIIHILSNFFLQMMFGHVDVGQTFKFVFVPEMLTTLVVASFVFTQLRQCASKLFA